jgi:threonine aldolase
MKYQFASDNTAGVCPEAWRAMEQANQGYAPSYGNDDWTAQASELLRELFEMNCDVYFVFNGTAANSLALASLCQSYHSVICHESAHIETDECGAPEFFSNGTKLLLAKGAYGKLDPNEVEKLVTKRSDIHYPKPKVVSLAQSTELGTVYAAEEIREIWRVARKHGLKVHMDGARFANAVASLDESPRKLTWEAGVDVLCMGGTKCGIGLSEAVVFFDRELALEFAYRCKQAGQLASKMRFLAAPWTAMLRDSVWMRYAECANRAAKRLAQELTQIHGIELMYPVQANAVFVQLPEPLQAALRAEQWAYYSFIGGGARFMCSWQTSEVDIQALVACLQRATTLAK